MRVLRESLLAPSSLTCGSAMIGRNITASWQRSSLRDETTSRARSELHRPWDRGPPVPGWVYIIERLWKGCKRRRSLS